MAHLIISRKNAPALRVPIEQERFLVGRDQECDLSLDDPEISRHHFEITWDGRAYQLTDLSRNGTFIDGERITGSSALAPDQSIEVGTYQLRFSDQLMTSAKDVTHNRSTQPTLVLKYEPAEKIISVEHITLKITPVSGRPYERTFDALPITFGAGQHNHVIIDNDHYVSRQHCQIESTNHGIILRDVGSRNGTWWNRQKIASQVLPDRGQFLIGKTSVSYCITVVREPLVPVTQHRFGEMLATTKAMQEIFALIVRVAPSNATVMIAGESGTGKELLARAIHAGSGRAHRPFVAINCGAIPATIIESELFGHERGAFTGALAQHKGVFEQAHGGTLFLDEIGEMPLELQTRLLRVLENRTVRRVGGTQDVTVDLRIVAATHRDLPALVAKGLFREDLFYRLYMFPMVLPPLRERADDIVLLAQHFLRNAHQNGQPLAFSDEALQWMRSYRWPGNIRELKHCVERAVVAADGPLIMMADMAPPPVFQQATAAIAPLDMPVQHEAQGGTQHLREHERQLIENALFNTSGNITEAAKRLGIARTTLNARIRTMNLDIDRARGGRIPTTDALD